MTGGLEFEFGSGNVFADAGLPNPDECLERAWLMSPVTDEIRMRRLTHAEAAALLSTDESTIADLMANRFHRTSLERLSAFATALEIETGH